MQVFHLNVFQVFSAIFASVLEVCFKCFICLLLYVATVTSGCLKIDRVCAQGMSVGSGWWRGDVQGGMGNVWGGAGDVRDVADPLLRALAHEPDALGARSLPMRAVSRR